MFRISKLTDYAIVLLSYIGQAGPEDRNARDLAQQTRLPLPTVSKILKVLARAGLLLSRRGVRGGYALARTPDEISIAEVIGAIEGPIALTDCSTGASGQCELEGMCPVRANWQRINQAVQAALLQLKLSDMLCPRESSSPREAVPMAGVWSNLSLLSARKNGEI